MEPTERQFVLFKFLNGGSVGENPISVGRIPDLAGTNLKWEAKEVYLSARDAQKIRHHPMHGMNAERGLALPLVIAKGDYYQIQKRGTQLQIEVVLHEPNPRRAYYLVLARNREDTAIFLRTFYFTAELSRSRMKTAKPIYIQSNLNYFG